MWKVLYDLDLNHAWYNLVERFSKKIPDFSSGVIRKNFECVVFNTYRNTTGTEQEKKTAAVKGAIMYLESLIH